ncbi:PilW family protein [Pseudomonas sp. GCM10022186]|uniref:PilW family protein n=1 Tax=Pseudomonas sp. GCM10022186 TaxID=3252650 RepID=UPI003607A502
MSGGNCGPTWRGALQRSGEQGFSLIELMVAMVIGLLLVSGLLTLVMGNLQGYGELMKSGYQIENGRFASEILHDDLAHAGFLGGLSSPLAPAAVPDPCDLTSAKLESALGLAVQGWNSPNATTTPGWSCLNSVNYKAGTDVLVVRRVSTNAVASLSAGNFYLQASPVDYRFGDKDTEFDLPAMKNSVKPDIRVFIQHIYFISTCSDCSGNGDGIPTLKRLELTAVSGSPALRAVPLVEGIENLQIDYGLDDNGNGSPERFVLSPASVAEWESLVVVRFNLLVRNLESSGGYSDDKKYSLGGAVSAAGSVTATEAGPFNDGFKRHVFGLTVRLTNPAGRKES